MNVGAYGGQKRALCLLELEFVIPAIGARTELMSDGGVEISLNY